MERNVSVVGAGDMGQGFAVQFALHGQNVALIDHRESNLERATERIGTIVRELGDQGVTEQSSDAVLDAVSTTLDAAAGVAEADVVLETVPEDLDTKQAVFRTVRDAAPEDAILASNTSGIPITDIASAVPDAADRVVGCHWWFPPYLLEPVEVVRGERTSDRTMDRTRAFVEDVDRRPITVEKDVPGFVWNRVQNAVIRECLHLAEAGVASVADINAAIRDGYARRTSVIGPFETMDVAGVDQFRTVASDLYPHLCNDEKANETFDELVRKEHTGIESGGGFFEYDDPSDEIVRERDERLAALERCFESFGAELGSDGA